MGKSPSLAACLNQKRSAWSIQGTRLAGQGPHLQEAWKDSCCRRVTSVFLGAPQPWVLLVSPSPLCPHPLLPQVLQAGPISMQAERSGLAFCLHPLGL